MMPLMRPLNLAGDGWCVLCVVVLQRGLQFFQGFVFVRKRFFEREIYVCV